ncbi:MAG: Uma2 family endonuclease [Bryobacteraceae bacterium]|nr:Uma2 family endonuclease [Bryobacteraceae bacterium]
MAAATPTKLLTFDEWSELGWDTIKTTELVDGEVVPVAYTRAIHEWVKKQAAKIFWSYFARNPVGEVYPEVIFELNERLGRRPDVSIFVPDRIPPAEGPFVGSPEIVFEVVSSETTEEADRRIRDYFAYGAKYVVMAYPESRSFWVYDSASRAHRLESNESLTFPDLLPGFSARVGDFFPGPPPNT